MAALHFEKGPHTAAVTVGMEFLRTLLRPLGLSSLLGRSETVDRVSLLSLAYHRFPFVAFRGSANARAGGSCPSFSLLHC